MKSGTLLHPPVPGMLKGHELPTVGFWPIMAPVLLSSHLATYLVWLKPVLLLGTSAGMIGLVGFSLLKRHKDQKQVEESITQEEGEQGGDGSTQEDKETPTIEGLLSRATFPMTTKTSLVKALGGEHGMVRVADSSILPASEVTDRCFSKAKSFSSPPEVVQALSRASWISAVMSSINMVPFPMESRNKAPDHLAADYIEGVAVSELLDRIKYPIKDPTELLSKLSEARFGSVLDDVTKEAPPSATIASEPSEEALA